MIVVIVFSISFDESIGQSKEISRAVSELYRECKERFRLGDRCELHQQCSVNLKLVNTNTNLTLYMLSDYLRA